MKATCHAGGVLILLAAVLGCAPVFDQKTSQLVTEGTSTFRCGGSPSGECAFLLYSSECHEGSLKNGHPVLVCTHELISEFSLKVGESKTFNNLPANVKKCESRPNVKPKFPDCVR